MPHCRIHGREFEYWEGCPECRDAEVRAEQDRAELLEALEREREERRAAEEDAKNRTANPGDYECPECRYVTLRRMAKRCPKCHAIIPPAHWPPIVEAERRRAEERERERQRAAQEWAAGESERRRQAKTEEDARRRASEARIAGRVIGTVVGVLVFVVLFCTPAGIAPIPTAPWPIAVGIRLEDAGFPYDPFGFILFGVAIIAAPFVVGAAASRLVRSVWEGPK